MATTAIAPITAITAVLLFTGWVRTKAYFGYFGIDANSLALGPQDYVLRSGDLGIGAVLVAALAIGVLLVIDRVAVRLFSRVRRRKLRQHIKMTLAIGGVALAIGGMYAVAAPAAAIATPPSVGGAAVVALGGLLILRFGASLEGSRGTLAAPTAAFALAIMALAGFWALDRYAGDIGRGAAVQLDGGVIKPAIVTVLSRGQLDLPGTTMSAVRVAQFDNQWAYRYAGARLLQHANNTWFLLTSSAAGGYRSTVTVLPDNADIRVQLTMPE